MRSTVLLCSALFLSTQVSAHVKFFTSTASADKGIRDDVTGAGNCNSAQALADPVTADASGTFPVQAKWFNQGNDGSTVVTSATIDLSGTGSSFTGGSAKILKNGVASQTVDVGVDPLSLQLPAGTACATGTCLVALSQGNFGNCIAVKFGNAAAAAPPAASSSAAPPPPAAVSSTSTAAAATSTTEAAPVASSAAPVASSAAPVEASSAPVVESSAPPAAVTTAAPAAATTVACPPRLTITVTAGAAAPTNTPAPAASSAPAPVASSAPVAPTAGNLQTFTGTLGAPAPEVFAAAGGKFTSTGVTFNNAQSAIDRSCSRQANLCSNAVNGGKLAGTSVADCFAQEGRCKAQNVTPAVRRFMRSAGKTFKAPSAVAL